MPAFQQEHLYTTEYIESLPEGVHAELIDGILYNMAPPNTMHQRISGRLYAAIYHYIVSKKGNCEIFVAPFAVYLRS